MKNNYLKYINIDKKDNKKHIFLLSKPIAPLIKMSKEYNTPYKCFYCIFQLSLGLCMKQKANLQNHCKFFVERYNNAQKMNNIKDMNVLLMNLK